MNYVTFETANRLKEAGFPQAETLEFAQVFYAKSGIRQATIRLSDYGTVYMTDAETTRKNVGLERFDNLAFAPTATDILALLGNKYWYIYLCFIESIGLFRVYEEMGAIVGEDKNPAEAAAQAWLSIHEKNNGK